MIAFFPRDTRLVEMVTSLSLITSGIFILLDVSMVPRALIGIHNPVFWILITLVFGLLQFIMATMFYRATHARSILSWIIGTFFVWTSIAALHMQVRPSEITTMMLGLANLYAFIVNALLVREQWTK